MADQRPIAASLDHANVVVTDMERSLGFYRDLLGLTVQLELVLEGEWIERIVGMSGVKARCVYLEAALGGARLELLQYVSPEGESIQTNSRPNTTGLRHFAFVTEDLDAACERLAAAGLRPIHPPVVVPLGGVTAHTGRKRLCYFLDPDGVIVELADYSRD
jgi:catechol 2,3-dioxygenase-like lactoylglutathione lyase family enzyme